MNDQTGSAANDVISGDNENNTISALTGNDTVYAGSGDDVVEAGSGDDLVYAGDGNDTISGDDGHDFLSGDAGADTIAGGEGDDTLHGMTGDDVLEGGKGDDALYGGLGDDTTTGGEGADFIDGGEGSDTLQGGAGNDTLQGGSGQDVIDAGEGDNIVDGGADEDTITAGAGADSVYGGGANDQINAGDGNNVVEGGGGDDVINSGAGDDLLVGDFAGLNNGDLAPSGQSWNEIAGQGAWAQNDTTQEGLIVTRSIYQDIKTEGGEDYNLSFDMALVSAGSAGVSTVEVFWNGELVDTISPDDALFTNYELSVEGTGGEDRLEFRETSNLGATTGDSGIASEIVQLDIGGTVQDIPAFVAGQSNLYQVINDELYLYDTEEATYEVVGDGFGFKVNGVGYDVGTNLLYGFATQNQGADVHGNAITKHDLVAIDAEGNAHKIGHVPMEQHIGSSSLYIGEIGPDGSMWAMNGGNRTEMFKIDINNVDANGELAVEVVPIPSGAITEGIADWTYVESENAFFAIADKGNALEGVVYKIDPFNLVDGEAQVTKTPITSLLTEDGEIDAFPNGTAWGAMFTDRDGNLYAGMNSGDHDLSSDTGNTGAIYRIDDFGTSEASAVLLSAAPATGSNDGASDPRSMSAFAGNR